MHRPGERQELKALVAEASQALAQLDANRLEELALSCQMLSREVRCAGAADRERLAREVREAAGDLAIYAGVLEATRANVNVMHRLRELRVGRLEYAERHAEGFHGNN